MLQRLLSFALASALALQPSLAGSAQSGASAIESARRAYWEGRFEVSLNELQLLLPSLTAKPELRDAYFLIGLNQLAFGKRTEARASLRAAVSADPSFAPSEDLYPPDVVTLYREVLGEMREKAQEEKAAAGKPSGAPQRFDNVKLLISTDGETEETEAVLSLEDQRLLVRSKMESALLKEIAYDDIKAAHYTYSRRPQWNEGVGFGTAVRLVAAPLFFMKEKKHWLTIQTENDFALLRLDNSNYQIVLLSLETKGGVKVEVEGEN